MKWGDYEQLELVDYLKENFGDENGKPVKKTTKKKNKKKKTIEDHVQTKTIEFYDTTCEKLFNIIKLTSEDVGFSWPTDMLYGTILQILIDARDEETVEGLKNSIYRIRYPEELWIRIKNNRKEIEEVIETYIRDQKEDL
ncbi:MAG: hypothetical protein K5744_02110 [Eubacterium sp.]|nr:hypothetical protein [Eubacterium sp.]